MARIQLAKPLSKQLQNTDLPSRNTTTIGRRKIKTRFQLLTDRPREYTSHDVFLITNVTVYQTIIVPRVQILL